MAQALYKNVGSQSIAVFCYKSSDGTPLGSASYATVTLKVSKDKGALTLLSDNSGVARTGNTLADGSGIFIFDLSQDETNADLLVFVGACSTSGYVVDPIAMNTVASGTTLLDGISMSLPAAGTALGSLTFREGLRMLIQRFLGEVDFDATYLRIKDNSGTNLYKQTYTGAAASAKNVAQIAAP